MTYTFRQRIQALPKAIWAVTLANLLIAISVTMTFSISPFFMTTVLGISVFSMGAMEGFAEGLSQISKLFSGMLGDYAKKRKPTLLFGMLLTALSKPFFILANGASAVMIAKVLERISNGFISTPRDAYVADISSKEIRGAAFGVMMTGKTVGCIAGPFLVSFLMIFTDDLRMLLWIGMLTSVVAIVIVWKLMREPDNLSSPHTQECRTSADIPAPCLRGDNAGNRFSVKDIAKLPFNYWSLVITSSLFMFARVNDGFLALRLQELGAPAFICVATIGIFNAISTLCCYPIGHWSDKIDRSKLLYFSYISLFLSYACFIFAGDMWLGLLGVIFWGAQRGSSQLLFTAIVADESPKKIMGTAIGIFYIIIGIVALLAGTILGWLGNNSLVQAFIFGAIVSILATMSLTVRNYFISAREKGTAAELPVQATTMEPRETI